MLQATQIPVQRDPAVSPALMRDDVLAHIRADILACVLTPGAKIHEQVLAEQYGVSKSPVRDALQMLGTPALRADIAALAGYESAETGRVLTLAEAF